jgi:hypothetical protein
MLKSLKLFRNTEKLNMKIVCHELCIARIISLMLRNLLFSFKISINNLRFL